MSEYTYLPPSELGPIAVGDAVVMLDRNGKQFSKDRIVRVGKTFAQTACGRRWSLKDGSWISEYRGSKPVCWPFPAIAKAAP